MNYNTMKDSQKAFTTKTAEKTKEKVQGNKVAIGTRERSADEQELKEIYKVLRKPRSRKYMKALKMMDILSAEDERLIAEMKKDAGIAEGENMTFQPEDIETFKAKIAKYVEEEMRKEEEALRKAEEERKKEERKRDRVERVMSTCAIKGCVIHTIDSYGNILGHHTAAEIQSMGKRYCMAKDILLRYHKEWSSVDVYKTRLVHRSEGGDTIQIIELDEADWGE